MFQRFLPLRNDLGWLSEKYDPQGSRLVGLLASLFVYAAIETPMNLSAAHNGSAEPRQDGG
jgi:hypothetical protein